MSDLKLAKSALISVFSKDGLAPIAKKLHQLGITIYSTGGTEKYIKDMGIEVVPVEDLTSYPSILGGRVKTLHPKVFGGILARREEAHRSQLTQYEIPEIDLAMLDDGVVPVGDVNGAVRPHLHVDGTKGHVLRPHQIA